MQKRNDILKQALLNLHFKEMARIDEMTVTCSFDGKYVDSKKDFLEKIHVIFSAKQLSRKKLITLFIAAALVLSLVVTACACGKQIVDFFIKRFDIGTRFESNTSTSIITEKYLPTVIPDGYSVTKEENNIISIDTWWSNGHDEIIFSQSSGILSLNTERENYFTDIVNGYTIYCIELNNSKNVFWVQDGFTFNLFLPDSYSWDDAKSIIASVGIVGKINTDLE